jgi:glycosyltransferase involved in cell wall biosynthesis
MRILVTALSRFSVPTGICRFAANLARSLAMQEEVDAEVGLCIGAWQKDYFNQLIAGCAGIRLQVVINHNSSERRNAWYWATLPEFAKRNGAHCVHLGYPAPVRKANSYALVATIHDLYPYDLPQNFGYPQVYFNRWFLNMCVGASDALTCVSRATFQRLIEQYSNRVRSKRVKVIPNWVQLTATEQRPVAAPKAPYILSVAQHRKNKNLAFAIRGFKRLLENSAIPNTSMFVIVGSEDSETPALHSLCGELGVNNRVQFISGITEQQLAWLYRNCFLFVCTSLQEGFCLPMAEALQAGCRIVCTDLPVLRELTEHCRFFPISASPDQFLNAAREALFAPPPRANSTEQPKTAGAKYIALYQEVLYGASARLAVS